MQSDIMTAGSNKIRWRDVGRSVYRLRQVCIGLSVTCISARAYRERRGGVGGVDEVEAGDVNAAVTKAAQTQLVHLLRRRDSTQRRLLRGPSCGSSTLGANRGKRGPNIQMESIQVV